MRVEEISSRVGLLVQEAVAVEGGVGDHVQVLAGMHSVAWTVHDGEHCSYLLVEDLIVFGISGLDFRFQSHEDIDDEHHGRMVVELGMTDRLIVVGTLQIQDQRVSLNCCSNSMAEEAPHSGFDSSNNRSASARIRPVYCIFSDVLPLDSAWS